jgi:DNA polymerase III delta subunit
MVIFLYGADDYRREQRKKFYIEEFKKKYSGLSAEYFDLEEKNKLEDLLGFLRSSSLFQPKKLAALENVSESDNKKLAEILKPVAGDPAAVAVLSEKNKPAGALKFLIDLKKPSVVEEFDHLAGAEWIAFVKEEAKAREVVLSPEAVKFLAEIYTKNSWGFVTELEKLSNLGSSQDPRSCDDKRLISRADLEALGLETVPDYWAVMGGLRSQSRETRLRALEKLLSQKEPPAKIFNILASQWREKIPQMAEYDFMVKSGKLEYEEALLDAVIG